MHEHTSLACLGTSLSSLLLGLKHTSQVQCKLAHAAKHNDDIPDAACLANGSQQLRTESSAHTLNNHWEGTMQRHTFTFLWSPGNHQETLRFKNGRFFPVHSEPEGLQKGLRWECTELGWFHRPQLPLVALLLGFNLPARPVLSGKPCKQRCNTANLERDQQI